VTRPGRSNVAASVHQRLLNQARESSRTFNELLQLYAMERFLYRLSVSLHAETFVLKGALMLAVWRAPMSRPTMDIDLLGHGGNNVEGLVAAIREVCETPVEGDGLLFDPATVAGERIAEEAVYQGVRIRFRGALGNARIAMRLDIGFGDVVEPSPLLVDYPTLLDMPAPRLRGYTRESSVAEKLAAMVSLGELNSRMKDFFDIWLLSRHFEFDGATLAKAVARTFTTRGMEMPRLPVGLTRAFVEVPGKAAQWRGFIRKSRLADAPGELGEVVRAVGAFLAPITEALAADRAFAASWAAPGPWVPEDDERG